MKTIFKGIVVIVIAFMIAGCEKMFIDHPIAGHSFWQYGGDSIDDISAYKHFEKNGTFSESYQKKTYFGYEYHRYGAMRWSVDGNDITVYRDNSGVWSASERGKEIYSGFYSPQDSTVTLNGLVYEYAY